MPNSDTNRSGFPWFTFMIVLAASWYFWISPTSNKFVMSSEASASGYALATELWPTLSQEGQAKMAALYQKGYLTRNDIVKAIDVALDERPVGEGVSTHPTVTFGDDPALTDRWMWRELTGELASFNSKDAFENLLASTGVSWSKPVQREGLNWWVVCPWCPPN